MCRSADGASKAPSHIMKEIGNLSKMTIPWSKVLIGCIEHTNTAVSANIQELSRTVHGLKV